MKNKQCPICGEDMSKSLYKGHTNLPYEIERYEGVKEKIDWLDVAITVLIGVAVINIIYHIIRAII